jgi:CRP-like cAMP-binding protein
LPLAKGGGTLHLPPGNRRHSPRQDSQTNMLQKERSIVMPHPQDDLVRVMRAQPVFAGLDEDQFALALAASRIEEIEVGRVIYERGDTARHFFVLVEGRIRLSVFSRTGAEKVIEILSPGKIFGELPMFNENGCYPVTAVAASRARIARVANRDYLMILRECPATCLRMLAHVADRIGRHVQQIEEATLDPATDRLVRLLEARMPEGQDGPACVHLDETRQELASFLSMKPETLSRALRTLTESGAIVVDGRSVHVASRPSLLAHLSDALQ